MPEPDDIAALRRDLDRAGYTVDALSGLWGSDAAAALHRGNRVPALRALELGASVPLATLARLFVLGVEVDRQALDAALPSLGSTGAERLGLADVRGSERMAPLLDLRPYQFVDAGGVGSWWIASDLGELAVGGPLRADHVLGIGGASTTLSGLMITTPVDQVLDLGTGCGIQALHASRHCRTVVATDISPRALEIAALNAALNGIDNIEFRLGDLFEPVAGERFDQVLSNPPFVITPRGGGVPRYEYRDGGMIGDDLVATVVREVGGYLTPGGIAQLLGNWEYRGGSGDGLERVRGWLDSSAVPIDGWVIEREVQDAALYAETWIRDGGLRPGAESDALAELWLDDFDSRGVTAVGFGYLTLRAAGGAASGSTPIRRIERLAGSLGHNPTGLGAHLSATLASTSAVSRLDDEQLVRLRLTVSHDVTEERHYWPGAEHPTVMTLHQGGGFGRSRPLSTELAALVGACDGDLEVGSIVDAVAQLLPADADAVRGSVLPELRELIVVGFLLLP